MRPPVDATGTTVPLTWIRSDLRASIARACGHPEVASNYAALIATVIREIVALRRVPVRHALISEVVDLLAPAVTSPDLHAEIAKAVESLVDIGDLVERRDDGRRPYLLELASAAIVADESGQRAMLLGRAEKLLTVEARRAVRSDGRVRYVDVEGGKDEIIEELRFRGAAVLQWAEWAKAPPARSPSERLAAVLDLESFGGELEDYEVFDPTTRSWFYRDRYRVAMLGEILSRDGWAVAKRQAAFSARENFLFRVTEGGIARARVTRHDAVELAAACAARAAGGHRFLARSGGGAVKLHFPPPIWLARQLLLGEPIDADGSLVAARLPADATDRVISALKTVLFCEVTDR